MFWRRSFPSPWSRTKESVNGTSSCIKARYEKKTTNNNNTRTHSRTHTSTSFWGSKMLLLNGPRPMVPWSHSRPKETRGLYDLVPWASNFRARNQRGKQHSSFPFRNHRPCSSSQGTFNLCWLSPPTRTIQWIQTASLRSPFFRTMKCVKNNSLQVQAELNAKWLWTEFRPCTVCVCACVRARACVCVLGGGGVRYFNDGYLNILCFAVKSFTDAINIVYTRKRTAS